MFECGVPGRVGVSKLRARARIADVGGAARPRLALSVFVWFGRFFLCFARALSSLWWSMVLSKLLLMGRCA